MQFKPVPEPPGDLDVVESILEAVPTRAGAVDDCCQHLLEETRLDARSEAETWLILLRALELVVEEAAGYRRRSEAEGSEGGAPLESGHLQRAFRERVYGADSVLEILGRAEQPLAVDEVATEYRQQLAGSDRRSSAHRNRPENDVTGRVQRLLEWAALLGLAERTDDDRYS